jgi:phospholipid/cholesterol/gamma-HCH transport system substrate-binding protein
MADPHQPDPSQTPPPIPHVEFKAMLLLAFTALLVCAFLAFVLVSRGVFDSKQALVLVADDSEGVQVGMDLTFSGFPIGRVRRIELDEAGKARIVIDVPSKDAHWLRTSSIFTMERGLVGETRIRAFTGVLTDPPLPPDSVRTVLRGDTSSEIPRLVASMRALLENLERMTSADSSLNNSLGNVQTITGDVSSSLKGRYGVLGAALGGDANAAKVMAALDRTNALLAKADARVFGPKGVMDETQGSVAQLNALLGDARNSLKRVDAVLAEAQGAAAEAKGVATEAKGIAGNVRSATADLGVLRNEVDASLRKINNLVDEINRKWPFARDTEVKLP